MHCQRKIRYCSCPNSKYTSLLFYNVVVIYYLLLPCLWIINDVWHWLKESGTFINYPNFYHSPRGSIWRIYTKFLHLLFKDINQNFTAHIFNMIVYFFETGLFRRSRRDSNLLSKGGKYLRYTRVSCSKSVINVHWS